MVVKEDGQLMTKNVCLSALLGDVPTLNGVPQTNDLHKYKEVMMVLSCWGFKAHRLRENVYLAPTLGRETKNFLTMG